MVSFAVSACTTINFKEPVTSYTTAMSESAAVFTDYYIQQNEMARTFYFMQIRYHADKHIQLTDESGMHTALYFKYSPEGIKARTDAIRLIGAYGNKLAVMAGADSPQRISDSSGGILASVSGLESSFAALSGSEATYKSAFAKGSGELVSAVAKMYAEKLQQDALKEAIDTGHSAVNLLLITLQKDLKDFSTKNQKMYNTQLADLVFIYNLDVDARSLSMHSGQPLRNRDTKKPQVTILTESQRLALMTQAQSSAALYEGSVANRPDEVIAAMIKANNDLYAFSQNPREKNSLVALNSSLETFNARIRPFVEFYTLNRNN